MSRSTFTTYPPESLSINEYYPNPDDVFQAKITYTSTMSNGKPTSEQANRFAEAAREAGCDESEGNFERQLQKIAVARPKKDKAPDKAE